MRQIPDNNLAFPVFILLSDGSSGSGFTLRKNTSKYLVTAKHVLYDKNIKLKSSKVKITEQSEGLEDETVTILELDFDSIPKENVYVSKSHDVCAIKMSNLIPKRLNGNYDYEFLNGVKPIQISNSINIHATADSCLRLKDVLISNDVMVYGFPTSLGLQRSDQFDYDKPLLRKGIVANVYKEKKTIILDCPVYFGNSGGPVVQIEQIAATSFEHKIIGVVSQYIPFVKDWNNIANSNSKLSISNSGYSVAVSIEVVLDMLEGNS